MIMRRKAKTIVMAQVATMRGKRRRKKKKEKKQEGEEEEEEAGKSESAWFALAKDGKVFEVFEEALLKNVSTLLRSNTEDADAVFSLTFSIIGALEIEAGEDDEEGLALLIVNLAKSLSLKDEKEEKEKEIGTSALRLKLLTSLYNTLKPESPLRKDVLMELLRVAVWSKNGVALAQQLADAEVELQASTQTWKLNASELRQLYLLLIKLFAQSNRLEETQKYRLLYLRTFESGKSDLDEAVPTALEAIVADISSPSVLHHQALLNLKAVNHLAKSKEHSSAYRLLVIFAKEGVAEYLAFYEEKGHKDYLQELGLNHSENLSKIRALTICSLGLTEEHVSYQTLIKALQVSNGNEVEAAVIDAVQKGRIEAKIDQEKEQVLIQRTTPRLFEEDGWRDLGSKLTKWKDEVSSVLSRLQQAQARAHSGTQPSVGVPSRGLPEEDD